MPPPPSLTWLAVLSELNAATYAAREIVERRACEKAPGCARTPPVASAARARSMPTARARFGTVRAYRGENSRDTAAIRPRVRRRPRPSQSEPHASAAERGSRWQNGRFRRASSGARAWPQKATQDPHKTKTDRPIGQFPFGRSRPARQSYQWILSVLRVNSLPSSIVPGRRALWLYPMTLGAD